MEFTDGDGGMEAGNCSNRAESSPLDDKTKSLVLVNYFRSVPIKLSACVQNSEDLIDMLQTCYGASGNRWANFVAVDYYKVYIISSLRCNHRGLFGLSVRNVETVILIHCSIAYVNDAEE